MRVRSLIGLLLGVVLCACEDDCPEGEEGCACYGNQTCDGSLACRSDTCVSLSPGPADGPGGVGLDLEACVECAEGACEAEVSDCRAVEGCEGFLECVIECGSDAGCQSDCVQSTSTDAQTKSAQATACAFVACPQECVGGSSVPDGIGTTPDPAGPQGPDGPGPDEPGPDAPGPDAPGPAGPEDEPQLVSGTNWLTLESSAAPATLGLNGELGIEGVFYAYDDGCADVTWDAESRCITGTHCAPNASNWGVGIGFDFYNDGTRKTAWSADEHAARGIAISVRGQSSIGFQLWLTNLDPSFGESCEATADCTIAGPPDGYPAPSFNQTIYFTNLSKDDWGGTGIAYSFDPGRLLSLQFKVPSSALETSFELCVDRLGIIL